ncbi:putative hydro-lyase [Alphaproteobacteria bacterium]|nr:putative hydro-lyase [Alphaproteobacteria bacterium]
MKAVSFNIARKLSSKEIRKKIRLELYNNHTSGLASNKLQANIVILPKEYVNDFYNFCKLNPKSCPLVGQTKLKNPYFDSLGDDIDIRFDVPLYNIYKNGNLVSSIRNIKEYWNDNLIAFAIGCSFSFEDALLNAGLEIDHITNNKVVPMYRTNIKNKKSGPFNSEMVVSMRIFNRKNIDKVKQVSGDFTFAHGDPIHIGNPIEIGINNILSPDWGDSPRKKNEDEVYIFWACGVTPQNAIIEAKIPFCITHTPGHMLITDISENNLHK